MKRWRIELLAAEIADLQSRAHLSACTGRQGEPKVAFEFRDDAEKYRRAQSEYIGRSLFLYSCTQCGHWHITRQPQDVS
jgi:rubrerythrin